MKASRFLPPLLAAATLVLLGANAIPTAGRKHRLLHEHEMLEAEVAAEKRIESRLRAEIDALQHDPFYLERMLVETWHGIPQGAVTLRAVVDGDEAE